MDETLKRIFHAKHVEAILVGSFGDCSDGEVFQVDDKKMFVKIRPNARQMLEGEKAGLEALKKTRTVRVPTPYAIFHHNGMDCLVMDYLPITSLHNQQAELGKYLARLHLHNWRRKEKDESHVTKFGFDRPTYCGKLSMDNRWRSNWVDFYVRQRIKPHLERLQDEEVNELWMKVEKKLPLLFPANLEIFPSLLHGDLWCGNAGESNQHPFIYDPSAFYGHHEFDLAIADMFGGFSESFYDAYHKLIPKVDGFEQRLNLYKLFHYLNHWNHYGDTYKLGTVSLLQIILVS